MNVLETVVAIYIYIYTYIYIYIYTHIYIYKYIEILFLMSSITESAQYIIHFVERNIGRLTQKIKLGNCNY